MEEPLMLASEVDEEVEATSLPSPPSTYVCSSLCPEYRVLRPVHTFIGKQWPDSAHYIITLAACALVSAEV